MDSGFEVNLWRYTQSGPVMQFRLLKFKAHSLDTKLVYNYNHYQLLIINTILTHHD